VASEATKERFIAMYHLPETILKSSLAQYVFPTISTSSAPPSRRLRSASHSQDVTITSEDYDPAKGGGGLRVRTRPTTPENGKAARAEAKPKVCSLFNTSVLELVKLIQASLAIFGVFPTHSEDGEEAMDGLLCDVTVDGIQRWVAVVGEPHLGVEPMQRLADPTAVAALLSLVLAVRNKLAAIGWSHVRVIFPSFYGH
jgi:hypothetical protein